MSEFTVLLVDDEADFLETLLKRLNKRQIAAFGAGSGETALDWLGRNQADLVVLDVKMPGMDGIQTLREIKRRHPAIEVLMLTGHADMDAAMEGMEEGAFDYLMKPIRLDTLIYRLQDAHEKKALSEKQGRLNKETGTSGKRPAE